MLKTHALPLKYQITPNFYYQVQLDFKGEQNCSFPTDSQHGVQRQSANFILDLKTINMKETKIFESERNENTQAKNKGGGAKKKPLSIPLLLECI